MKTILTSPRSRSSRIARSAITAALLGLARASMAQSFGPLPDSEPEDVRFQTEIPAQSAARKSDLQIMGQLVNEALRLLHNPGPDYRMGIPVLVHPQSPQVHSLYLEGFGALFLARIDFPVLTESHPQHQDSRPPAARSPWESARRRVLGDADTDGTATALTRLPPPERLRELRLRLVDTLRQATNMTCLAENDCVAIRVEGPGVPGRTLPPDGTTSSTVSVTTGGGVMVTSSDGRTVTRSFSLGGPAPAVDPTTGHLMIPDPPVASAASLRSTLTLRVRKSDLDALASGKISLDTFASRIESQQYSQ